MCGKKIGAALAAGIISVMALSVTAFAAGTKVPINKKYFPDEIVSTLNSSILTGIIGSLKRRWTQLPR